MHKIIASTVNDLARNVALLANLTFKIIFRKTVTLVNLAATVANSTDDKSCFRS
jgi:hypothetical protein